MSFAVEVLEEVREAGATLYREGDQLVVRPGSAIPPAILARIRAAKPALLALVPSLPLSRARIQILGDGRNPPQHPQHPQPGKSRTVEGSLPSPRQPAREDPTARLPLTVEFVSFVAVPSPVRLDACTMVTDVERCVAEALSDLRLWVRRYSDSWAGEDQVDEATEAGEMIEILIERLAACGCQVRVVPVH